MSLLTEMLMQRQEAARYLRLAIEAKHDNLSYAHMQHAAMAVKKARITEQEVRKQLNQAQKGLIS